MSLRGQGAPKKWGIIISSTYGFIAADDAIRGEDYLPQLVTAGTEGPGTGQQIIAPHPVKSLVVIRLQPVPITLKIGVPGHEGLIIIGAEIMPVFHDKEAFDGTAELFNRGKQTVGEDIPVHPGFYGGHRPVAADSMQ